MRTISKNGACFLTLLWAVALLSSAQRAQAEAVFVDGSVVDARGVPVAGASVRVEGQNISLATKTDARGTFAFSTLTVGTYLLTVSKGALVAMQSIDVSSAGAHLTIALARLTTIAQAEVVGNPVARQSGTDVAISGVQIEEMPAGASLPSILAQLPSAANASNGQVHINGNHNGLEYYIDGVEMPADLNRVIGSEIDAADIGYLDVLEGAYPAQYGNHFAAVLEIGTRAYAGSAGYDLDVSAGSFDTYDSLLALHSPLGTTGGFISFDSRLERTNWALDPPVSNPVRDGGSDANQFLRASIPVADNDTLNFDVLHSLQTFAIPPDTALGMPAVTDDDEYQEDSFLSLQYRHAIGENGVLQFGPSFKESSILDTSDLENDLAAAGGSSCIDFTNCVFSVYANRRALDARFNAEYALRTGAHELRTGVLYDASNVQKDYRITMQPDNALAAGGGTYAVSDTAPNTAHEQEAYIQDSWRIGTAWEADYGLRADAFQILSTTFDGGFSQWSPRLKLTRFFGQRSGIYAYYGRLFVPFSFENVSPTVAAALYLAPPPQSFDLKPERDSLYETGGHVALGSIDVGLRIMHEVSADWIDDTQVGATNLHQDINFPQGRIDAQSIYARKALPRNGLLTLSVTHSIALNSLVCETNLLQNCTLGGYTTLPGPAYEPFYVAPGGGLVEADHDQHWDATGQLLLRSERGGWFSFDFDYGSGLSLGDPETVVSGPPAYAYAYDSSCANGDAVNCKVPPHVTVDVEDGVTISPHIAVALRVQNLLNDRYAITYDSTLQGTHYARPRAVTLDLRVSSPGG